MNGLVGNQTLLEAKQLLQAYREGKEPPGTTESQVDTRYIQHSTYRVFRNDSPKVFAYCSKNMVTNGFLSLLGAHQLWSI